MECSGKARETESSLVLARDCGKRGDREWLLTGLGFHSGVMEMFRNWISVMVASSCKYIKKSSSSPSLNYNTLKLFILWYMNFCIL